MMLPLLWRAGWSRAMLIWASPALFFGLAHLHHALQRIREGMPVGGSEGRKGTAASQPASQPADQGVGVWVARPAWGGGQVVQSLVVAVVQLCYTSMFGWYANTLFLRSALLWPCVLAHAFCNFMGLPDLSFLAAPAPPGKQASHPHPHTWRRPPRLAARLTRSHVLAAAAGTSTRGGVRAAPVSLAPAGSLRGRHLPLCADSAAQHGRCPALAGRP